MPKAAIRVLCVVASIYTWRLEASWAEGPRFRVTFDAAVSTEPYTGRVLVILSDHHSLEPRRRIANWFSSPQVLALDVLNVRPGGEVVLDRQSEAAPILLSQLSAGEYRVQAVARRNKDHPVPGAGTGDLYSQVEKITIRKDTTEEIRLQLEQSVAERAYGETERIREVAIESRLLTEFYGRPMKIRAGVVLPVGWDSDDDRVYPVVYIISGFGMDHRLAHFIVRNDGENLDRGRVLRVTPDATCFRGHSVFADSANNGPWARALVDELIPHIEKTYRGAESGDHRYVTGLSSGGWSAMWLQIAYPDYFNGCWAHAPDPVDFRDFMGVDIYRPAANLYRDDAGDRRPLARRGGRVVLWTDEFVGNEDILGPGGQFHSFEAVFSPRLPDGEPAPLFDRASGRVDQRVAEEWKKYDIRLLLERNWMRLEPKLAGKLRIYVGDKDDFYLDGAIRLLKKSRRGLNADWDVQIIPELGHIWHRPAVDAMYAAIVKNFRDRRGTESVRALMSPAGAD